MPTSSTTRCHFFKIPLELRDDIYDYVVYGEKTLGLHVNMKVPTAPKVHYYDEGLSRTCTQIRQEYTIRLERRIKQLMIDDRAVPTRFGRREKTFYHRLESQTILIAEREVMKGVWVQVDVASRSVIPFMGILDQGTSLRNGFRRGPLPLSQSFYGSTLTFTLASSAVRGYNRRFGIERIPFNPYQMTATPTLPTWDQDAVARYMSQLEDVAKPTRATGGFSFGADMQQPIPMCTSVKAARFWRLGVVGIPGFEDTRVGL
jgi:hypothetical protein